MEQIKEYLPLAAAFLIGIVFNGVLLPTRERIFFTHCNCSHGFENDEDCMEYVKGVSDDTLRVDNKE